jgi:hypothetical protein
MKSAVYVKWEETPIPSDVQEVLRKRYFPRARVETKGITWFCITYIPNSDPEYYVVPFPSYCRVEAGKFADPIDTENLANYLAEAFRGEVAHEMPQNRTAGV